MTATIHDFRLDVSQNQLLSPNGNRSVRPKTLELLLFFLGHPDEVLNKQRLLDEVWKSAGAQEHLLFQSVKEIRELFEPIHVIKTHPKTGYQWVAGQVPSVNNLSTKNPRSKFKVAWTGVSALALIFFAYLLFSHTLKPETPQKEEAQLVAQYPSREIIVLPFEIEVQGNAEDWVRLGAMDMLINRLRNLNQFAVPDAEEVMMAIARSSALAMPEMEQQANAIRTQIGEAVTLHTKLLGSTMEFQLHYTLIGRFHFKQGIVLGATVPELLAKLTEELLAFYQIKHDDSNPSIASQSADYALLQAMEHFHLGKLDKAEAFLMTYLHAHPDNLTAQRYLLKTKIENYAFEEAESIGEKALIQAQQSGENQEHVRLLFELGLLASVQEKFELAQQRLSESRRLAEKFNDTLYAAFAHTQLGHLMMRESHLEEAERLYQRALKYHQGFQCAYGQISNLQALSMLYAQHQDMSRSEAFLNDAIAIAQSNQLHNEYAHLLLSKIEHKAFDSDREYWLNEVQQLVSELENTRFKSQILARLQHLEGSQ